MRREAKDLGRLSEAWSVKIEVVAWGKRREGEEGEGEEMGGKERGGEERGGKERGGEEREGKEREGEEREGGERGGKERGGEEREEVVQPLYKLLPKMDIQKKSIIQLINSL